MIYVLQIRLLKFPKFTIYWYVDDNKLSQKKTSVPSDIINKVKKHFGDISVLRGMKHTLLGMNI